MTFPSEVRQVPLSTAWRRVTLSTSFLMVKYHQQVTWTHRSVGTKLCFGCCMAVGVCFQHGCVCVFVWIKLKFFVRQKQRFITAVADGPFRRWSRRRRRRRRWLPGVPLGREAGRAHSHAVTHTTISTRRRKRRGCVNT